MVKHATRYNAVRMLLSRIGCIVRIYGDRSAQCQPSRQRPTPTMIPMIPEKVAASASAASPISMTVDTAVTAVRCNPCQCSQKASADMSVACTYGSASRSSTRHEFLPMRTGRCCSSNGNAVTGTPKSSSTHALTSHRAISRSC